MKNIIGNIVFTVALLISGIGFAEEQAEDSYTMLVPPQPVTTRKIEVLEFFFYGCRQCNRLNGPLSEWVRTASNDVEFTYVPITFRTSWEPMTTTFYALQGMDEFNKYHDALFKAWNVDFVDLDDQAKILNFLGSLGIDRSKFEAAFNSEPVSSQVERSKEMVKRYAIEGTPTLIVDGKYVITGLQPEETIQVLTELTAKVRRTRPAQRSTTE